MFRHARGTSIHFSSTLPFYICGLRTLVFEWRWYLPRSYTISYYSHPPCIAWDTGLSLKFHQDVSKGASEFSTRCAHSHLEDNWSFFKNIFTVAVDKHVSSKMSTSRISLPWTTISIKRQMLKLDSLLIKSKAHGWQMLTSVAWISLPKEQSGEIT